MPFVTPYPQRSRAIGRTMTYSTLIYRNLSRRWGRSLLTVVGVAVAVAAVVAMVGISQGFQQSLADIYRRKNVDLVVLRAGSMQRSGSRLDDAVGARIAELAGVAEVSPVLVDVVSFDELDLFGVPVQGVRVDPRPPGDLDVVEGRWLSDAGPRSVVVGEMLARQIGTQVGQPLEIIPGESYTVSGIYESPNTLENGAIYMRIGELRELMGREGEVTGFNVTVKDRDPILVDELAPRIAALAPNLQVLTTAHFVESAVEMKAARAVAWLTSAIALVIGTIGMVNTMLTAVFERTRELAVLRAIGWRKARVVRMILSESLVLSLVGALAGIALAVALTQTLSRLPASGRLVSGDIAPGVFLQGLAVALVVGMIGGLYPAWRAAQLVPTEGLRHE